MSIRIGFIGAGNMASSIITGLLANGYSADQIWASTRTAESAAGLKKRFGLHITQDNRELLRQVDVLVLSVKPQQLKSVCEAIQPDVNDNAPLVISVAAGVRSASLSQWLGKEDLALVRAMPNTPSAVGLGAAGLYATSHVSADQKEVAEAILRAVGLALWVECEDHIDAVAAVSGSGPAYIFLVMEAMQRAGEHLGLSADQARLLVEQTVLGAAHMAQESDQDVIDLRRAVTSPGGTTQQAIAVFEQGGLRKLFQAALEAANQRARQMSDELRG